MSANAHQKRKADCDAVKALVVERMARGEKVSVAKVKAAWKATGKQGFSQQTWCALIKEARKEQQQPPQQPQLPAHEQPAATAAPVPRPPSRDLTIVQLPTVAVTHVSSYAKLNAQNKVVIKKDHATRQVFTERGSMTIQFGAHEAKCQLTAHAMTRFLPPTPIEELVLAAHPNPTSYTHTLL